MIKAIRPVEYVAGWGVADGFCQVSRRTIRRWPPDFGSCLSGLHDGERDFSTFGEAGATEGGSDGLIVTVTETQNLVEFTMLAT
jgi:hypothetical protein